MSPPELRSYGLGVSLGDIGMSMVEPLEFGVERKVNFLFEVFFWLQGIGCHRLSRLRSWPKNKLSSWLKGQATGNGDITDGIAS